MGRCTAWGVGFGFWLGGIALVGNVDTLLYLETRLDVRGNELALRMVWRYTMAFCMVDAIERREI